MLSRPWLDETVAANGRPIKDNFSAWFNGSAIVDAQGAPLTVFHGSRSPWLVQFDLSMEGSGVVSNGASHRGAIWFSSSPDAAGYFADPSPKRMAVDLDVYGHHGQWHAHITDRRGESLFMDGPHHSAEDAELSAQEQIKAYNRQLRQPTHVSPYFLALRNPLVLEGVIPRDHEFALARQRGHDGIVAREVVDGDTLSDVFVAFDPAQIKSARNCGLFIPGSACLRDLAAARKLELAHRAKVMTESLPLALTGLKA